MSGIRKVLTEEPAAITGFVQAVITMVVLFGVPITTEQAAAILTTTGLGLALVTRAMVVPTAKFDAAVVNEAENIAQEQAEPMTDEERATLAELRRERDTLRLRAQR